MAVPSYDKFIEPVLRYLAARPNETIAARVVYEAAADSLGLTSADKTEKVPSGVQQTYKNRAGWAHDRLKRAGYSSSPRRGYWMITPEGQRYASQHQVPLTRDTVARLADASRSVRLRSMEECSVLVPPPDGQSAVSPDEALETALQQIKESVAAELLEQVWASTPEFFEQLVLDLLHAMGYGTNRSALQRVGGSGDGGIDGIISLDRLGLEKVYVQAKRYSAENTVGRPDVQGFYGAIAGQRANKGVFITSSKFTSQAVDFARSVEGIVLVDGELLSSLMIEHGIGVSPRLLRVPRLDSDYFEP